MNYHALNVYFTIKSLECYCGDTYGYYGLASTLGVFCNRPCPNNLNEICGGENANSIYSVLGTLCLKNYLNLFYFASKILL